MPSHNQQPAERDVIALLELVRAVAQDLQRGQGLATVTLDTSLDRDLGLDSLSRVELLARVERAFGITLPEGLLTAADTPRDLWQALLLAEKRSGPPLPEAREEFRLGQVAAAPAPARTLTQALEWHVANHPDRPHIRLYDDAGPGEVITYGGLWLEAGLVAAGLQQRGVRPGETVLLMLPTGREYFFCFIGILLAGGVPVPLYPPGRPKQIEEHLLRHAAIANNCGAALMITIPEAKPFARLLHAQVPSLRQVVTVSDLTLTADLAALQRPGLTENDPAFLQYTSGSTGLPKGVVLTHANLLANVRAMGQALQVTAEDVFVSWLPLYHDMGLIGAWLGSLYHACPLVIFSPLSFIARPSRWLKAISIFGGTLSAAPNFAYELCLRRIDDEALAGIDLSSWRCAFNGAEAVSPPVLEAFMKRFAPCGFRREALMPVYGLAESSVGLAFPPLNRGPLIDRVKRASLSESGRAEPAGEVLEGSIAIASCGLPLPGHEIRIVDQAGRELPERQEGHLQFRGPSATSGYFRNPEQTARLFQGEWLEAGDRAYIAAGEVYITGRIKDIVIRAGRNIYPEEIEEAIGRLAGIRAGNVAVFGTLDPSAGTERLIVLAETRRRKDEELEGLRRQVNGVVNDLCGTPPDEVVLAPPNTVLKTSSGKIRRAASRELYEKGLIGRPQRAVWLQILRFTLAGIRPRLTAGLRGVSEAGWAGYGWLLFAVATLVVWPGVILLPCRAWRWSLVGWVARSLALLTGIPLRVQGREQLTDPAQPAVLVCNHASYLDGVLLAATLPPGYRFVAKAELKGNFWSRVFLQRLGTEFVERFDQHRGLDDSRELIAKARAGASLFYFAEGTFTRMPGLLPFRLGAFETAVKARLPVIPLVIRGSRGVLRAGSWFPRRGVIRIEIGPPCPAGEVLHETGGDEWQAPLLLRDRVRGWILNHCGEPDLGRERPTIFTRVQSPGTTVLP